MYTIKEKLTQKELLDSLADTSLELVQSLDLFTEEEFNTAPFAGSWTAGQVGEHLLKAAPGITKILSGNSRFTERLPDEKVRSLESIFLDFSKKAKSAQAIWPSDEPKEKKKTTDALNATMNEIKKTAEPMDLSKICTDFPFPTLGEMTRWEWITFAICHTKKHIYQIENIYKRIKDKHSPIVG